MAHDLGPPRAVLSTFLQRWRIHLCAIEGEKCVPPRNGAQPCHWRIGLAPRFFDLGRGELVFFRRFPVFFEQNPTLNRKKSFRCAKGRAFSFFSGRKKFFFLLAPRNRGASLTRQGQRSVRPEPARQWLRNGGRSGTGAAAAEANTTGLEPWLSESSGSKFSHERVPWI